MNHSWFINIVTIFDQSSVWLAEKLTLTVTIGV